MTQAEFNGIEERLRREVHKYREAREDAYISDEHFVEIVMKKIAYMVE